MHLLLRCSVIRINHVTTISLLIGSLKVLQQALQYNGHCQLIIAYQHAKLSH
jgi:hypothetical protein